MPCLDRSRLARALWIEIYCMSPVSLSYMSRLARALWIEIPDSSKNNFFKSSRFARALWIEIVISYKGLKVVLVEARESLVD